jgi:CRP-like cAMP-binding protein
VIIKGRVKIVKTSVEGYEVITHVLGPGEMIRALSILGKGAYSASAIAMEEVHVCSKSADDFTALMRRHP